MKRMTLIYKGPSQRGFRDRLTDALKVCLSLYIPFLFKVIDSNGFELETLETNYKEAENGQ